jgi:hypothetical protein
MRRYRICRCCCEEMVDYTRLFLAMAIKNRRPLIIRRHFQLLVARWLCVVFPQTWITFINRSLHSPPPPNPPTNMQIQSEGAQEFIGADESTRDIIFAMVKQPNLFFQTRDVLIWRKKSLMDDIVPVIFIHPSTPPPSLSRLFSRLITQARNPFVLP